MPFGIFKKPSTHVPAAPTALGTPGVFGKVPKMGDFVRVGKPVSGFETWLEAGMAWGAKKHGEAWQERFDAGAPHAFVFRSRPAEPRSSEPRTLVAGVMRPSRDRVGRRFPLTVYASLDEPWCSRVPHLLPLLLRDVLVSAMHVLSSADSAEDASFFEDAIKPALQPAVRSLDAAATSAEHAYTNWSRTTLLRFAWSALFDEPESDAPLVALKEIRESLAPFAQQENLSTPLGLRLPLGAGGADLVAFWVDVVRRTARWRTTVPTFFWGNGGPFLLQLGVTSPGALSELWCPDPDSDVIFDVGVRRSFEHRAALLASLPGQLAFKLERADTSVSELLDGLDR